MKNTQRKPSQLDRIEVELQHQNEKLDQILRVIARRRRTTPRRDSACGRGEVTAARRNRARVITAIRDLRRRHGLSVAKAIRQLRGNGYWTSRMKGVKDRSWASYFYGK